MVIYYKQGKRFRKRFVCLFLRAPWIPELLTIIILKRTAPEENNVPESN